VGWVFGRRGVCLVVSCGGVEGLGVVVGGFVGFVGGFYGGGLGGSGGWFWMARWGGWGVWS